MEVFQDMAYAGDEWIGSGVKPMHRLTATDSRCGTQLSFTDLFNDQPTTSQLATFGEKACAAFDRAVPIFSDDLHSNRP